MPKKIKDVTFEEFYNWFKTKACNGDHSIQAIMMCYIAIYQVLKIKPVFNKKKAREKEWNRIKHDYVNLDTEIDV